MTTLSCFEQTLIDESKAGHVLCPSLYPSIVLIESRTAGSGVAQFCVLAHSSSPVTSREPCPGPARASVLG